MAVFSAVQRELPDSRVLTISGNTWTRTTSLTAFCGFRKTNRNKHYAARCLGGFSFASSRSWLRGNFCYQAIYTQVPCASP